VIASRWALLLLGASAAQAGAWSAEPFGNDDALDWAADLPTARDFAPVEAALDAVLSPSTAYLDSSLGSRAVAAGEILAKALGRGTQRDAYTRSIDAWLASLGRQPDAALRAKAVRALERVRGKDSELAELWADDGGEWQAGMEKLLAALR